MSAAFKRLILVQTTASLSEALRPSEETENMGPKEDFLFWWRTSTQLQKSTDQETEAQKS